MCHELTFSSAAYERAVDRIKLASVQVFSQERHRHVVAGVMTLARVSTTRPLQNGHCDGRTGSFTRESGARDMPSMVPRRDRRTLFTSAQAA